MTKINLTNKTKKIINTVIIALVLIALAASSFVGGFYVNKAITEKHYASYEVEANVISVNPDTSEVFFTTPSGHSFYIVTDEVFAVGENYVITFLTNNTATVEDDEITLVSRNVSISMY